MNQGLIQKIFSWIYSPQNDDSTTAQWGAGLVAILAVSFLWYTVTKMLAGKGVGAS